MPTVQDRIECPELLAKLVPVEEAIHHVTHNAVVAVSGFTKSGEPKTFLPALAKYLKEEAPETRFSLFSGASLSEDVEGPVAPFIAKRGPYMSSSASRALIHTGQMDFADVHLSQFARNVMAGFYGDIDLCVIEVSRIRKDGSVILSSSVGISPEVLTRAKKIILEVNTSIPDYTGFHDIAVPPVHPEVSWPLPVTNVGDRIGTPYVPVDLNKVVAVIESTVPDHPVPFRPTDAIDRQIAKNVVDFLLMCQKWLHWGERLPPLQSGVGNVANAIVSELYDSPFQKIRFWTEVFQDGMLRYIENEEKFEAASATAVSFSAAGRQEFIRLFSLCRDRLVLRPMWLSNCPELIARLFVIAMNTPIEVDMYGHANSTHIDGSRIVNGLGGSGDFLRNAYLSLVHTPSIRKLKDGRTVSSIMPYVRHIDHTEHDIKCIVTEQGVASLIAIRSARHRALDIIDQCAHPHFRNILKEYLRLAKDGDEPRLTNMDILTGWWKDYDAACRAFPE